MPITAIQIANYAAKLDRPIKDRARNVKRGQRRVHSDRLAKRLAAIKLGRLEDVLAVGNWLYTNVRGIEQNWRTEVLERKTPYRRDDSESIADLYSQWARECDRCLNEIRGFEAQEMHVRGAREFKAHCAEVTRVLSGDYPFFNDAEKAGKWAALTSELKENPRPVRIGEDGRIFEMTGERFNMPGLEPADILEALEDERAGRLHSYEEVFASCNQHET